MGKLNYVVHRYAVTVLFLCPIMVSMAQKNNTDNRQHHRQDTPNSGRYHQCEKDSACRNGNVTASDTEKIRTGAYGSI